MTGRLDAAALAEAARPVVRPALLAELTFVSQTLRVWTGIGSITLAGQLWSGLGEFGRVSAVEETVDLRAAGATLQLSGVPADLIATVSTEPLQGRSARLLLVFLDAAGQPVGPPAVLFHGRMDTVEILDGAAEAVIALTVENRLRDLERPRLRRYTDADQQAAFPGDRGFAFVPALQELEILWGPLPSTP